MLRVIDARSGRPVRIGDTLGPYQQVGLDGQLVDPDPDEINWHRIDQINEKGIFGLRSTVELVDNLGSRHVVPLMLRWTHPNFFGQRVAFIPS